MVSQNYAVVRAPNLEIERKKPGLPELLVMAAVGGTVGKLVVALVELVAPSPS